RNRKAPSSSLVVALSDGPAFARRSIEPRDRPYQGFAQAGNRGSLFLKMLSPLVERVLQIEPAALRQARMPGFPREHLTSLITLPKRGASRPRPAASSF